ncbi:nucleoside-diphosphate-sugar epimerase [Rhizomicrobium palustre]|uniref:Nucleoside-diphosphate-sugar epimerase n=1 Tax=Rhizomicrobium palustre TaxID=189966 RepID=A0A846MV43_9PROT|nr:SDR family oxidoreductase [Rhizomicrobium palustre]NIK87095.1 nucleoside-diphosphate-sugar epimerase [Rhizomicrobium palustre]
MRVFVTGASGFIGMAVAEDLIAGGHSVLGLCRSRLKAPALAAIGAEVLHADMQDDDALIRGASQCDSVIHLAFNHDFTRFKQNCEDDRRVVAALATGLKGSDRPLLVTSGTPIANTIPGEAAKEGNPTASSDHHPRAATEEAAAVALKNGVNIGVVRLPQVHDTAHQGLITPLIQMYREKGVCFYLGDGASRWPAAYYRDVARLYRLAVERAEPNAKYHAVAEEGVAMRVIAETIAARLNLPAKSITQEEAPQYFGWLSRFAGLDMLASSAQTRAKLGWNPVGPGLLEDLANLAVA